jgi:ribosomal protein S27E
MFPDDVAASRAFFVLVRGRPRAIVRCQKCGATVPGNPWHLWVDCHVCGFRLVIERGASGGVVN